MSLEAFYDRTVNVTRLATTTGERKAYTSHITGLKCTIQPDTEVFGENRVGAFGKQHVMLCPTSDIREKDLVVDGDTTYKVVGVVKLSFKGHEHMEVLLNTGA